MISVIISTWIFGFLHNLGVYIKISAPNQYATRRISVFLIFSFAVAEGLVQRCHSGHTLAELDPIGRLFSVPYVLGERKDPFLDKTLFLADTLG